MGSLTDDELTNVDLRSDTAGIAYELTDVKPGDHGLIIFSLTVQNNPAWVASCIGYGSSHENKIVEPETEAESAHGDGEDSGKLEENLQLIPFYSPGPNTFFDANGTPDGDWMPGDMGA